MRYYNDFIVRGSEGTEGHHVQCMLIVMGAGFKSGKP